MRIMFLNFTVFLRDRETHRINCYSKCVVSDDIEHARHNILVESSDYDFECIKVRFDGIEYFA